jgi:lipocalin
MALTPINLHDYLHEVGAAAVSAGIGCNPATPYGWLHGRYPQARIRTKLIEFAKESGYALDIPAKEIK